MSRGPRPSGHLNRMGFRVDGLAHVADRGKGRGFAVDKKLTPAQLLAMGYIPEPKGTKHTEDEERRARALLRRRQQELRELPDPEEVRKLVAKYTKPESIE